MYMSLTPQQVEAISDPVTRQLAQALLSMQAAHVKATRKAGALEKNTLEAAKARRDRRIEDLAKRLPPAGRQKLLAHLSTQGAALSLADDGTVRDPLASTLDILEAGIRDLPALLRTPSAQLSEVPHPEDYGSMSEDRRQAVVAEQCKNSGMVQQSNGQAK